MKPLSEEEMQDMPVGSLCLNCHNSGTYFDLTLRAITRSRNLAHGDKMFYCGCTAGQLLHNKHTLLKTIDPNYKVLGNYGRIT